jgi:NAD(P)H-hydrate epimerase
MIEQIHWATAIVIGPGIGISHDSEQLLNLVITHAKAPLLIDADGLNILASTKRKKDEPVFIPESIVSKLPKDTILTPHIKELSRLINMTTEEITSNLLEIADKCTDHNELIFVIKDPRTVAAYKEERYVNISGNNGMATGGSGDVLTGIIVGFIAGGLSPWEAAKLGVYIHGLAGDKAAEKKGCYSMVASDIIEALPDVLEK